MTLTAFERPDGSSGACYLARPSVSPSGVGILIAHELWGVDATMAALAERLATLGHCALVPDLFGGKHPKDVAEGLGVMASTDTEYAVTQDLAGGARALKSEGLRVCMLGLCYGGALTVAAATRLPDLEAAVCFYGIPDLTVFDAASIRVPFQGHFARRDNWCTPDKVDALEQRLKGPNVELYRYDADHAFMNPTGPGYSAETAAVAWERCVSFIQKHVGAGG
jgi:carboxymethylenebutenolidase